MNYCQFQFQIIAFYFHRLQLEQTDYLDLLEVISNNTTSSKLIVFAETNVMFLVSITYHS